MTDLPHIIQIIITRPAGMRKTKSAAYIDVSLGHFGKMVRHGLMPPPRLADGVEIWVTLELDEAVLNLPTAPTDEEVTSCDAAFGVS